ncbi:PIN/TRAM domain-containing protein [Geosporobacter ferrireducens]|uniref:Twitching motility protein PilT n=1 Tax=Geosporobacter ferrireducens TaxID=1424294 RepID=A0A1D8GJN5_9FIRM|nr:PIN/TRAM domain-containing protein [Geosporobacter ferrireducens]AOT71127.1 twitching motility protein PilT [Geosporobacter ferrireducens]MTI57935.1 PIN/TRAM domain-containing protein [Geosporobacter ferrireducens]
MFNKIIRGALTLAGASAGYATAVLLTKLVGMQQFIEVPEITPIMEFVIYGMGAFAGGIIFFIITPWLMEKGLNSANWVEGELQKIPTTDMVIGSLGLIIGLFIAYLISQILMGIPIPFLGTILSVLLYIFLGYLGVSIATKKRDDLWNLAALFKKSGVGKDKASAKKEYKSQPKILDTSVIIDGRIADITQTGFVEGPIVIPEFVLEELRHIADSSDSLKRNRGRRGLDILNRIQKELQVEVQITDKDFEDVAEVDIKLLKLAQFMGGKVVTNDYNLNKIAELQGVPVLNINELANAVKPVVLPGEEMIVQVIKEGKESGQGVAYLDDGTMIVVEGGRKHIGETMGVLVTSVLQTAAGRMIFAKPKSMADKTA